MLSQIVPIVDSNITENYNYSIYESHKDGALIIGYKEILTGVLENMYLFKTVSLGLKNQGFNVFFNKKSPLNDGGLSFGQASVAAAVLEGRVYVSGNTNKNYFH